MSETQSSGAWTYIIVALRCFIAGSLWDIERQLDTPATEDKIQIEAAQEAIQAEARKQSEAETQRLIDTPWSQIEPEMYGLKFLAHEYHLMLFGALFVLAGPWLMKRSMQYR